MITLCALTLLPFSLPARAARGRTFFRISAVGWAGGSLTRCRKWLGGWTCSRVSRGGSWNNNESRNLLSSYRNNNTPDNRNDNNGFRVVMVVGSSR